MKQCTALGVESFLSVTHIQSHGHQCSNSREKMNEEDKRVKWENIRKEKLRKKLIKKKKRFMEQFGNRVYRMGIMGASLEANNIMRQSWAMRCSSF